jgi:outer membrane protein TolC
MGVTFSLPVFLRTSVNEYKISKLNAQNNQFELNNSTNEIQFKEKVIWQNISVLNEQLSNSEKNVRYSKLLLEAEQKKFDHGESSLFLLNTRESKLLEAELKLAEYRLKFIKNVLELVYLRGGLNYNL